MAGHIPLGNLGNERDWDCPNCDNKQSELEDGGEEHNWTDGSMKLWCEDCGCRWVVDYKTVVTKITIEKDN